LRGFFDRFGANAQVIGNVLVLVAFGDHLEYLALALREGVQEVEDFIVSFLQVSLDDLLEIPG